MANPILGTEPERGHCDASFKRLEQGTFEFPKVIGEAAGVTITATDLSLILGGVALAAKRRTRFTPPTPAPK